MIFTSARQLPVLSIATVVLYIIAASLFVIGHLRSAGDKELPLRDKYISDFAANGTGGSTINASIALFGYSSALLGLSLVFASPRRALTTLAGCLLFASAAQFHFTSKYQTYRNTPEVRRGWWPPPFLRPKPKLATEDPTNRRVAEIHDVMIRTAAAFVICAMLLVAGTGFIGSNRNLLLGISSAAAAGIAFVFLALSYAPGPHGVYQRLGFLAIFVWCLSLAVAGWLRPRRDPTKVALV